jgi:large subunit ribosomal protein L35
MPKIKSHSGAKKRFRKTSSGKWLHRKAGLRHLLTGMSAKRGRNLRQKNIVESSDSKSKVIKSCRVVV